MTIFYKCPFTFNSKEIYGVFCLKEECIAWNKEREECSFFAAFKRVGDEKN